MADLGVQVRLVWRAPARFPGTSVRYGRICPARGPGADRAAHAPSEGAGLRRASPSLGRQAGRTGAGACTLAQCAAWGRFSASRLCVAHVGAPGRVLRHVRSRRLRLPAQ